MIWLHALACDMMPDTYQPPANEPAPTFGRADTIVAPITCAGRGCRSAVRLSGPRAHAVVAQVCEALDLGAAALPLVTRSRFWLAPRVALPVLVAIWRGPRSFTGEDCAEFHFAGSPAVSRRLMGVLAMQPGVRAAEAGEFSARAFLNGRMTLEEAEGVAALISAASEAELRSARRLTSGEAGRGYGTVASELTTLLALVEAGVDFSDQEDVVAIGPDELVDRLQRLADLCRELGGESGLVRSGLARVVLVGAPNAGKSTIFNSMVGRKRVVESAIAGSTRDVIIERVDLAAGSPRQGLAPEIELADLPGLFEPGPSEHRLEAPEPIAAGAAVVASQGAARDALSNADMILWCDPAGRFDASAHWLGLVGSEVVVVKVRTFADRPLPVGVPDRSEIAVCGLDPGTRLRLGALIAQRLDAAARGRGSGASSSSGTCVVPRHGAALAGVRRATLDAIRIVQGAAASEPGSGRQDELVAECLRRALDEAGTLVGRIDADEVLGRIFSTFCVGK